MSGSAHWQPLSLDGLLLADGMRPRITEAESSGEFFSGELGGRFNDGSEGVAQLAGVFPVGVVDAPELISGLRRSCRQRIHADSEHDAALSQVRITHFLAARVRHDLRMSSPLEFELVPNNRDGSGKGVRRGIRRQDLELERSAGRSTNHLHNICQGKAVRLHE